MLHNCEYDKIKILHMICKLEWFIRKHAKDEAKSQGEAASLTALESLQKDLEKHIEVFHKLVCKK